MRAGNDWCMKMTGDVALIGRRRYLLNVARLGIASSDPTAMNNEAEKNEDVEKTHLRAISIIQGTQPVPGPKLPNPPKQT